MHRPFRRRMIEDMTIRVRVRDPTRLRSTGLALRNIPRPIPDTDQLRGSVRPLPTPRHRAVSAFRPSTSVSRRCGTSSPSRSASRYRRLPSSTSRAGSGRAEPSRRCRALLEARRSQHASRAQRGLWRWPACLRGRLAQGLRHRRQTHDDPRRAGQGPQGSPRHALATAARTLRTGGRRPARGLALPRPDPVQPITTRQSIAPVTPRPRWPRSTSACRCTPCGTASPPTCSSRTSTSRDPGAARARQARYDALYTGVSPPTPSARSQSARSTRAKLGAAGHPLTPGRVPRPALEVADIFRDRGRLARAHAGHVSLGQLKVMTAIERCRTAALGGHVEPCEHCAAHRQIAYNSCRNRHCPKCRTRRGRAGWRAREAELLPVDTSTSSSRCPLSDRRRRRPDTERSSTTCCSRPPPRRCCTWRPTRSTWGADRLTAVLHTWGPTLTHHPHVHVRRDRRRPVVRWPSAGSSCRPGFFLPVRVLSRVFRRQFLGAR